MQTFIWVLWNTLYDFWYFDDVPILQVTYHELETGFSGDSSSLVVVDTEFSLEQLQPGRNYSISVAALSNNVESLPVPVYQATSEYTAL